MKKLLIILLSLTLYNCDKKENQLFVNNNNQFLNYINIDNLNVKLYIIDSCEYIGYVNNYNADFLTHKGNCKNKIHKY